MKPTAQDGKDDKSKKDLAARESMIHALSSLEGWRKRMVAEYQLTPEQISSTISAFSDMQEAFDFDDEEDD